MTQEMGLRRGEVGERSSEKVYYRTDGRPTGTVGVMIQPKFVVSLVSTVRSQFKVVTIYPSSE